MRVKIDNFVEVGSVSGSISGSHSYRRHLKVGGLLCDGSSISQDNKIFKRNN